MSPPPKDGVLSETYPQPRFQWNSGSWFGSHIGASLWIFLVGAEVIRGGHPGPGWLILAIALVFNGLCVALWARRERTSARAAYQVMIYGCGLTALAALVVLDVADISILELGSWALSLEPDSLSSALLGNGYLLLLVYPAMAYFLFKKRKAS